jgi:hypothetical protein
MGHRVPVPQESDNSLGCQLRDSKTRTVRASQSQLTAIAIRVEGPKGLALDRGCLNNDSLLRRAKQRLVVAGGVKASR